MATSRWQQNAGSAKFLVKFKLLPHGRKRHGMYTPVKNVYFHVRKQKRASQNTG
jgi:hypothetical protein